MPKSQEGTDALAIAGKLNVSEGGLHASVEEETGDPGGSSAVKTSNFFRRLLEKGKKNDDLSAGLLPEERSPAPNLISELPSQSAGVDSSGPMSDLWKRRKEKRSAPHPEEGSSALRGNSGSLPLTEGEGASAERSHLAALRLAKYETRRASHGQSKDSLLTWNVGLELHPANSYEPDGFLTLAEIVFPRPDQSGQPPTMIQIQDRMKPLFREYANKTDVETESLERDNLIRDIYWVNKTKSTPGDERLRNKDILKIWEEQLEVHRQSNGKPLIWNVPTLIGSTRIGSKDYDLYVDLMPWFHDPPVKCQ